MKYFLFVILFSFSSTLFAQLDDPFGSISLEGLGKIEKETDASNSVSLNFSVSENHSLSTLNKGFTPLPTPRSFTDPNEQKIDMKTKDAGYDQYVANVEIRFLQKDQEIRESYKSDTFLGDYKTNSKTVTIMYRDHEYVDGDRVKVYVNDKVVKANVLLGHGWQGFTFELNSGFNKFQFEALNMGTSGPNTAAFQITDDNGNLLAMDYWNLTTGVVATLVVVKE